MASQNEKLLKQIQHEYDVSYEYVVNRRQQFRDRLRLYNNQKKDHNSVGVVTLYTTIQTLLAIFYSDELTVNFKGRTVADDQLAENINHLARFDHDEMDLAVVNYNVQWDKLFYWVWLRIKTGWDSNRKVPLFCSESPLNWYPDPNGGIENDYKFHWFEKQIRLSDLRNKEGYKNLHLVKPWVTDEQKMSNTSQWQADWTEKVAIEQDPDIISIYHWYTCFNWKKYLVTLANERSLIIRKEEIKPVWEEEKKDNSLVKFPVVTTYFSPQRNNPFGVSVGDLTEDKQRAISVIANLRLAKEKAALYPQYFYDKTRIRNKRDLEFGFNKAVAVDWPVDQGIFQPMQKDLNKGTSFNVEDSIDREAQLSTGAGTIQSGVLSEDQRTLWEQQLVQNNANLRFLLSSKINAWGEKKFWGLWYRSYKEHFKGWESKLIRINTWFGQKPIELSRKDFFTVKDPDIDIESRFKSEKIKEKERLSFTTIYPIAIQDQSLSEIGRRFLKREFLKVNAITDDKVNIIYAKTPEEISAEEENELLKRDEEAIAMEWEDHLTHIFIHNQTEQTPSAIVHIQEHYDLYRREVEKQKQIEQAQIEAGITDQTSPDGNIEAMATIWQAQASNQLSNLTAKES